MKWWSRPDVQSRFPVLALMARTFFAVPCSSTSVERIFSISGYVLRARRCRLLPSHADLICFLHDCFPLKTGVDLESFIDFAVGALEAEKKKIERRKQLEARLARKRKRDQIEAARKAVEREEKEAEEMDVVEATRPARIKVHPTPLLLMEDYLCSSDGVWW